MRNSLWSWLCWSREYGRRISERHPAAFRRWLEGGEPPVRWGLRLTDWQERDFAALDAAWLVLAGRGPADHAPQRWLRRAYLERPRGHSKTTDMAIQVTWILQHGRRTVRGLAAAADQDQARLLHTAVADLVRRNASLCPDLQVQQNRVHNRRTGSRLDVIASDINSSWGLLPDFIICDELCHWPRAELWYSLCSAAAKQPHCVLVVLTNAGVGHGWQWEVRETARVSPEWYFASLPGPCAPWISAEALAEQRRLLPPAVYARLWDNVWQQADSQFVTLAEAEACRDSSLCYRVEGQPDRQYVAAIDYAEKHDRTVGVVVHRAGDSLVVDRMDVAVPRPGQPVLVSWVEDWLADIVAHFPGVRIVVDEYQLLGVIQRWSARCVISRFDFAAGRGHHALALTLRQLIVQRKLRWYPGCGQLPETTSRDDLETELAHLLLRESGQGRLRIAHRSEPGYHDDRAFALGAACWEALREKGADEWLVITPPATEDAFRWR